MRITGWFYRDEFDRMPPGVKNGVATSIQLMNLQVSDKFPLIVACPIRNTRKFDYKAYAKYWRC
jgi:hypothetical protein